MILAALPSSIQSCTHTSTLALPSIDNLQTPDYGAMCVYLLSFFFFSIAALEKGGRGASISTLPTLPIQLVGNQEMEANERRDEVEKARKKVTVPDKMEETVDKA